MTSFGIDGIGILWTRRMHAEYWRGISGLDFGTVTRTACAVQMEIFRPPRIINLLILNTPSEMASNVVGLPPELLQCVAVQLHQLHPPSVWSLALANKTCHALAVPCLFQNLCLRLRGWPHLSDDVARLREALSRNSAYRHVLSLSIQGKFALPSLPVRHGENVWMLVAELVVALPHLADVTFSCPSPFPACILEALHGKDPLPRLSLQTFKFRTPRRDAVSPDEMALATSPCLHSITVQYLVWGSRLVDYNRDAVMRMVAGMAPNLREIRISSSGRGPGQSPDLHAFATSNFHTWQGFPGVSDADMEPGRLTSLTIVAPMRLELLQVWTERTDFTLLRTLHLETSLKMESLQWLGENCRLPSLRELGLKVFQPLDRPYQELVDAVAFFLTGVPPLETLALSGVVETQLLDLALLKQGDSLHQLTLGPFTPFERPSGRLHRPKVITGHAIQRVGEACPKLRDLTVYMCRSKSDSTEAATYRAFGQMVTLKRLSLHLNCSNYGDGDSPFDEFGRKPFHGKDDTILNGHVQDVFLNCAMDEPLARSIWTIICRHKTGAPLQSLRLEPFGGRALGPKSVYRDRLIYIVSNLSRAYLLERINDYGGEGQDNVSLSDLKEKARKETDERGRAHGEDDSPLTMATMRVFRSIWPEKEGSVDWRDDWSSLALQSNE